MTTNCRFQIFDCRLSGRRRNHQSSIINHQSGRSAAGFGLLEVVLSAGILALIITGVVGLMNASLRRTALAADRAVAMNLAQEGIELVRGIRDTIAIDGHVNQWAGQTGVAVVSGEPQQIRYSPQSHQWELLPGAGPEEIPLDDRSYRRSVFIELPDQDFVARAGLPEGVEALDVARKVRVLITWGQNDESSVESITYLTDWRG